MEITINGKSCKAEISVLTLVLYEEEFDGADLIADLNGKVYASDADPDEAVLFDFTKTPWTKLMQGVWALLKTADESVPHFEKWAREVKELNSFEAKQVLSDAVSDAFFHIAATVSEGE